MTSLRTLFCGLLFSFVAIAVTAAPGTPTPAEREAPLVFPQLQLTDGRVLKNVQAKSFDRTSGKLLVIADGTAMLIPFAAIPPTLHSKLQLVPPSGATVSTFAVPPAAERETSPKPGGDTIVNEAVAVPTTPPPPYRATEQRATPGRQSAPTPQQPTSNQLLAAQAGDVLEAHKAVALKRAQTYYRFEFRLGSDAGAVTGLELDATNPKPVTGWPGRYRTEGRAYLEFYDSRGRSFQRRTSSFEVVTERKPGDDDLVVIEFTPKS